MLNANRWYQSMIYLLNEYSEITYPLLDFDQKIQLSFAIALWFQLYFNRQRQLVNLHLGCMEQISMKRITMNESVLCEILRFDRCSLFVILLEFRFVSFFSPKFLPDWTKTKFQVSETAARKFLDRKICNSFFTTAEWNRKWVIAELMESIKI